MSTKVETIYSLSELKALQKKYELSMEEVERAVENAIVHILRRGGRRDFEIVIRDGAVSIWKWSDSNELFFGTTLRKKTVRKLKWRIANELYLAQALKRWQVLRRLVRSVVEGEIVRIAENGDLHVNITTQDIKSANVVAVCKMASQTPKERGRYKVGLLLHFYVLSVLAVRENGLPRVDVYISRNSRGFTEALLRKELLKMGIDVKIKCQRRIAGAFSEIIAEQRLPNEAIIKVGYLLNERIKVRVQKSS